MPNYTKLFNSIVTSTIWTENDQTRIVWITMLAISDKNGEIHASIPGLARVAGVSLEQTQEAITKFLSPDPYSRTPDDGGRRIEEIDGGWALLNHLKYRELASKEEQKTSNAIRQQRFRAKKARNATGHNDENCAYCGKKAAGVDHVIPKCKGGGDGPENLVRCCKVCNSHKASRDLVDFLNDLTLPFALSSSAILSSEVLSKKVTLRNGIWSCITDGRDIAEAEAEAKADIKSPLTPQGGIEIKPEKKSKNLPTSQQAIKIANLFRRRLTTSWSDKEIRAFKAIGEIDLEDLDVVCRYTEAERAKGDDVGRHRRDLLTFLNNFHGEVDRAKSKKPERVHHEPIWLE